MLYPRGGGGGGGGGSGGMLPQKNLGGYEIASETTFGLIIIRCFPEAR